jgi:nucleotide-binding universal stress UspA family protein
MNAMRSILAATDMSAPSRQAAVRAAMVAVATGARLDLVHVVESGVIEQLRQLLDEGDAPIAERLIDGAREELRSFAAEISARFGISPAMHMESGKVLQEISNRADALDSDLLVLGSRGAHFMRHILLGATAERLLRTTQRPMLVVKQVAHEPYTRVLVGIDFSACSLRTVQLARAVAPAAELILFHSYELPFEGKLRVAGIDEPALARYCNAAHQEAQAAARNLLADAALLPGSYRLVLHHGDAAPGLLEQEEECGADLLVIGKHGKSATEELLLGSVTKHVLAAARADVLVVR